MNSFVEDKAFTNPPLTVGNLDRYAVRIQILKALKSHLGFFHGEFLDIGCGKMPYRHLITSESKVVKYVGLDIESALPYDKNVKPDFFWDGQSMPFNDASFDCAMMTEVLEHCPDPELVMREALRVLKPGGVLFFTVPFIWNLHEVPHDHYRYTPFALQRLFERSGFEEVNIQAGGGWHASMAQMLGLWVRRSPMGKQKRRLLSVLLRPIIGKLLVKDQFHPVKFIEGQMITGLFGYVKRPK